MKRMATYVVATPRGVRRILDLAQVMDDRSDHSPAVNARDATPSPLLKERPGGSAGSGRETAWDGNPAGGDRPPDPA